jgi:YD repeat-containing protein
MKKFSLLCMLLINMSISGAAQVISPPPNSSSVAKMVDNSVDLHTGAPRINLPLHTIQGAKLSYPISISYNGSGIKVSEVPGTVGLGWSLNAESMITRAVRGRPDEFTNSYFSYAGSIPDETDAIPDETLFNLADGKYDMQPDLFYFSTGWDAGKFVFDNQLVPQTIPKKPLKISFDDASTLAEAIITTYDGTKFIYINGETSSVQGWESDFKSSWYLSRIISADNADTIKFNYDTSTAATYDVQRNGFLYFFYNVPEGVQTSKAQYEVENSFGIESVSVTGTKYLESIESSLEKVVFDYGSRTDKADLKKLDYLRIYQKHPISRDLIEKQSIRFSYSYFQDTSGEPNNSNGYSRLKLDLVQQEPVGTIPKPPYEFLYSTKKLPPLSSFAQDPWGYYNGAISNNSLVPFTTFNDQEISTSDRQIHAEFVDGFILSKIISPLGGITEYFFEPNTYGASNTFGPGLRIAKIVEKDPYSKINAITNYEYKDPSTGNSSGILLENPSFAQQHLPVVEIVHGDTVNYDCMLIPIHATGAGAFSNTPLIYEYVTVFKGDSYNVSGKTTFKFSIASPSTRTFPYFPEPDYTWRTGRGKETKHYKVENGTPTIVKFSESQPVEHPTFTTIKGFNAGWSKIFILYDPEVSHVIKRNFVQESKFTYVAETKVYDYEQNNAAAYSVNTENVYYERTDGYYLPNRISTKTSESNITLEKEFKYPVDYAGTGVFGAMQSLNMVSSPVEVKSRLIKGTDNYIVDYQKTDYLEWGPSRIYPQYFYSGKFSGPVLESSFLSNPSSYLQRTTVISSFDESGFVAESEQEGGRPSSVIFDQRHSAPAATFTNARSSEVGFTSFESSYHGNWNVNAGSEQRTKSKSLSQNGSDASLPLENAQTVTYTYSVTQTTGPRPTVTFSKAGEPDLEVFLNESSSSGSVSLTAGTWTARLTFDTNVSSVSFDMTYSYTHFFSPNIVDTDSKTGSHCLSLTSTHTVSKTGLPPGNYVVSYYQKDGAITFGLSGSASIVSTESISAGTDGWEHVKKTIEIVNSTDQVQISGVSIKMDELRLYPVGGIIQTTCYDNKGRVHTTTDHNLRSQFYEYDQWGRPSVVRDHDRNIVSHQEYKIAGN